MKNRSTFKNEDWLIIITSDHGGSKRSHGGQSIEEKKIPIILSGSFSKSISAFNQVYLVDIVPTILNYFNIKSDPKWNLDGKSLIN